MVKKKKEKTKLSYLGFDCDSIGEIHFLYYIEELIEAGYVKNVARGNTYELSTKLVNPYTIALKTKSKEYLQTILQPHEYSYDFTVEWTELGLKYFCNKSNTKWENYFFITSKSISYIECKPEFDYNNMTRLVTLNVKWMWQKYGMFIQVVKNEQLFKETFTPKILLTTKTGIARKLKYKAKTLEEYIKTKEK